MKWVHNEITSHYICPNTHVGRADSYAHTYTNETGLQKGPSDLCHRLLCPNQMLWWFSQAALGDDTEHLLSYSWLGSEQSLWKSTGAEVDRVKTGPREKRVLSAMWRKNKIQKIGTKRKGTNWQGTVYWEIYGGKLQKTYTLSASIHPAAKKTSKKLFIEQNPIHKSSLWRLLQILRLNLKVISQMGILIKRNEMKFR